MDVKLNSKIGLPGGIGLVMGGVIGLGVYIMIPSIAGKAGSATWLAILIAMSVSIIGVIPLIQLSSALPVAGGGYNWCSRLLHPLVGTLVSNFALFGGSSSVCVVSVGLADYLQGFLPFEISVHLLAMLLIGSFFFLYLFGLRLQLGLQIVLSIQMILALVFYVLGMWFFQDVQPQMSLDMPDGFAMGVLLAFNVCFGFQIITEMGEEMKEPHKNIPLALLLGAFFVFLIYVGLSVVYVGTIGSDIAILDAYFHENNSPLITSAEGKLPVWMVYFLGLGAVSAGLTSFNAGAIALPRELFAQARDKTLPAFLGKINSKTETPINAIIAFFSLVIVLLLFGYTADNVGWIEKYFGGNPIDFYGIMTVCGIMLLTVFASFSSLFLNQKYKAQYAAAYFRMPPWLLYVFASVSVLSSLAFVLFLFYEAWIIMVVYIIVSIAIVGYFFWRKKYLAAKGIEIGNFHDPFDYK
ncbi:MAG: APC family permease [Chitinophagales bacterium]